MVTVVDMEAGLEHLSRGTDRHVDTLLVVAEPYFKALETARRCVELGRELNIPRIAAVANVDEARGKRCDISEAGTIRCLGSSESKGLSAATPSSPFSALAGLSILARFSFALR